MNSQIHTISYPEPDSVLTQKPSITKYLKYLGFFGPGAVVASMTIGQGQLILGPQIGAWAGYTLLWLILLNIGSYIIAFVSCRFTLLSGIGLMDLFAIKSRGGWINWIFIIILLIFVPIFTATILTTLGQTLAWILNFGHYFVWGILFLGLAGSLALAGRYKLLELTQAFFVAILAIGAVVSVIYINPDWFSILPNFFNFGNVPSDFPLWVYENYPTVTNTSIPFYMLGYLGTLTFTLIALIGYIGWIKVKKWGIFRGIDNPSKFSQDCLSSFKKSGKIDYLPQEKYEIKKSRILLKPLIIDLSIAFIIVAIVSAAYMIAGSELLAPSQHLPRDAKLIQDQVIIFEHMASWLKPLFQISVIFALFGTLTLVSSASFSIFLIFIIKYNHYYSLNK